MSYTPTEWKDHIVEHPNRFRVVDNGDGTVNILDEHGNIIQQGTPVNAANLNKMEQGIKEGITKAEQAQQTADELRQKLNSHGPEHNHDGADPIPDLVQLQEDLVSHENNILIHRQIHLSTNDPDPSFGGDGDIWLKYSDVPFYEHGEWTPVLTFGVPPTGLELSRQDGFYIRQGKLVTIFYYIQLASKGTDGGGRADITNLPFPNNSKFSVAGSVGEVRGVDIPDGVDFTALIAAGDDTLQIRRSVTTDDDIQSVRYLDFTDTARIIGQFSYFID